MEQMQMDTGLQKNLLHNDLSMVEEINDFERNQTIQSTSTDTEQRERERERTTPIVVGVVRGDWHRWKESRGVEKVILLLLA